MEPGPGGLAEKPDEQLAWLHAKDVMGFREMRQ
jgi:hypothetical protein